MPGSINLPSWTTPVIERCGITFVPFSYDDNRFSLGIAAYRGNDTYLGYIGAPGTRYVYAATVDADAGTVTFFGQGGTETTLTWAQLDALAGA